MKRNVRGTKSKDMEPAKVRLPDGSGTTFTFNYHTCPQTKEINGSGSHTTKEALRPTTYCTGTLQEQKLFVLNSTVVVLSRELKASYVNHIWYFVTYGYRIQCS
jgi:hypothetical protein